jgi:mono/diheme cytochrome c family protein
MGEGLRNTISLRGRAAGQGFLHWSNNFDELQDFEGQIRSLAGGTGLMSDEAFNAGTRSEPLGDPKAGQSSDLDALAAYVASLASFAPSPARDSDGNLTPLAVEGRAAFARLNCAACHGGQDFTNSGAGTLVDVGTLKAASGQRLGGPLTGIDVPTLRDAWTTAPYLHDGSAPSLSTAIESHADVPAGDLAALAAYVEQIGSDEGPAPVSDQDGDGVVDALDNCMLVANASQRDTNGDGYGNQCDADFNGNGVVDSQDGSILKAAFGSSAHPDQDLNGNGVVDSQDGALLKARFGQETGPSGLVP